jgi:hypothetical protein
LLVNFDFLLSFEVLIEKTGIDQGLEGLNETQQKNEHFFLNLIISRHLVYVYMHNKRIQSSLCVFLLNILNLTVACPMFDPDFGVLRPDLVHV